MDTKEAVRDLLSRLPKDCTIEDVQYHLYVLQAIQRGRTEISEGKGIDHQKVARELMKKWHEGSEK